MSLDADQLCDDLQAEHDDLVLAMAGISEESWEAPTPAAGWSVRDQISHLAYFDRVARIALTDAAAFDVLRAEALADLEGYVERALGEGHGRSGEGMLAWFASERGELVAALRQVDPATRVPWFGPSMSAASKATARIMETWAHGQDVVDALGLHRPATSRLHHVAHIGVRALPNSYRAHGLEPPGAEIRVELRGPAGEDWSWGPAGAGERVAGPALDFCLVVTQRRHVDDTALAIEGDTAREWVAIAQAFAGPPGAGRQPGQFDAAANGGVPPPSGAEAAR